MRILRAVGVRPRRTIRIALWTGEEQGLLGSFAYVTREIAALPRLDTPAQQLLPEGMRRPAGAPVPKPGRRVCPRTTTSIRAAARSAACG